MRPGRYLQLRREAAGLGVDDTALEGDALAAIESGERWPTDIEMWALSCSFPFDIAVLIGLARGVADRICRACGCTEHDACVEVISYRVSAPCAWAAPDLCTACAASVLPLAEGVAA